MDCKRMVLGGIFLVAAMSSFAAVRTAAFRVDGMDRDEEARRVTASLKRTPGVLDAAADFRSEVAMVKYDDAEAKVSDLAKAVDIAGFTLSPIGSKDPQEEARTRVAEALGDFNSVLGQTKQALDNERYGLVRNLALAMKVRRDAVLKVTQTPTKGMLLKDAKSQPALVRQLSASVDEFAAAAEARKRNRVNDLFPRVKQAYRRVAESYDMDALLAAPPPPAPRDAKQAPAQEKSLADQLKDLVNQL